MLILIFSQKQYKVRPQHLFTVKMEFRWWMSAVTSGAVGAYGWRFEVDGVGYIGPVGVSQ